MNTIGPHEHLRLLLKYQNGIIRYQDMNEAGEPIFVDTKPNEAIRLQRKMAREKGMETYKSDVEALYEFMICNYAWVENG